MANKNRRKIDFVSMILYYIITKEQCSFLIHITHVNYQNKLQKMYVYFNQRLKRIYQQIVCII